MNHRALAEQCWLFIKALDVRGGGLEEDEETDEAAINLIALACDSAAEAAELRVKGALKP